MCDIFRLTAFVTYSVRTRPGDIDDCCLGASHAHNSKDRSDVAMSPCCCYAKATLTTERSEQTAAPHSNAECRRQSRLIISVF